MSIYADIKNSNDEEEERFLKDLSRHETDDIDEDETEDFWDWWDGLDDIEREEYNRLFEEEEDDSRHNG